MNADRVWRVYHRGELVGEVDEREFDFPWIRGRFRPEPAFQPLRPIFAAWIEALNCGDGEAMRQAHEAIYPAVTMTYPDGREVPWSSRVTRHASGGVMSPPHASPLPPQVRGTMTTATSDSQARMASLAHLADPLTGGPPREGPPGGVSSGGRSC